MLLNICFNLLQLDVVTLILVELKKPIIITKLYIDRYTYLTRKQKVKYISSPTFFLLF